jgi:hypothetical protein
MPGLPPTFARDDRWLGRGSAFCGRCGGRRGSESPRTVSRASGRSVLTRTATAPGADSRAPYVAPIERSRIGYIQRVLGRPTLVFVAAVTSSAT